MSSGTSLFPSVVVARDEERPKSGISSTERRIRPRPAIVVKTQIFVEASGRR
jgi:hypothetical protein